MLVQFRSLNRSCLSSSKGTAFVKAHILFKYEDMKLNSIIATASAGRKIGSAQAVTLFY